MPQKIFLDTNVWFSALYGSENCQKLLHAQAKGEISTVVSQEVLKELLKNIKMKIPHAFQLFEQMLLSFPPEIVEDPQIIPPYIKTLVHQKDQRIFAAAVVAKVNYFITGNIKDFQVKKLEKITGIKILTPKEVVEVLKRGRHLNR